MPLETLEEPNIKRLGTEIPRRNVERFNPFRDLGRQDYEKVVENIRTQLSSEITSGLYLLAKNFLTLHTLFPQFKIETEALHRSIPLEVLSKLKPDIQHRYDAGNWTATLKELVELKCLDPDDDMKDSLVQAAAWRGLETELDMLEEFENIRTRANFRLVWPRRYAEFFSDEEIERTWRVFRAWEGIETGIDKHMKIWWASVLVPLRIAYPEQFKRDIHLTPEQINGMRTRGGDYETAILSADEIEVDDGGIHLIFNPEFKADVIQEIPEPIDF